MFDPIYVEKNTSLKAEGVNKPQGETSWILELF